MDTVEIQNWITTLIAELDNPDVMQRYQARQALLNLGRATVESLGRAIEAGNAHIARQAAEILAEIADVRRMDFLLKAAHAPDPILRQKVILLLGNLICEEAQVALCDALHDELELVRVSAAQAIGESGNSQFAPCLLDALEASTSETMQYTIIEALGKLGDPTAIPAVTKYLDSDNAHVRSRAEQALQALQSKDENE
ncbi:MAG TPA: HEAT repeat domain-containing protein [Aggregatilineales bacterium]|nr:HEAT repeat domain-containing protein [Aggregatilineales bacterium]